MSTCFVLTLTLVGCATPSGRSMAQHDTLSRGADQAAQRTVHAIPMQTASMDGQTSWIIEPDMPRIPKIVGLDAKLPPHIEKRLSYAFDLAQRGAPYTADAEFRAVLGLCALELDARDGGTTHREALHQGLVALREADQFGGDRLDWHDAADVRRVATSHSTPVLHDSQAPIDSIQAVQAYYAFAERRLAYACQGLPGTSLAYYGLARTIVVPEMKVANANGKAVLLHRVALAIAPQNLLAANELGVLLAQHGQLDAAEKIFKQSLAIDATPETWRNLAAVYARQGNDEASRSALATGESLAAEKQRVVAMQAGSATGAAPPKDVGGSDDENKKPSFFARTFLMPNSSNTVRR